MSAPIRSSTVSLFALLLVTQAFPALGHCPHNGKLNHPHCKDGGGPDSGEIVFKVDVVVDPFTNLGAPIYAPVCSALTKARKAQGTNDSSWFERHDLCATVVTSTLVSFQLRGQDVIGKEGIAHESEVVEFFECVADDAGFTLHVDAPLTIWKLDKHNGGKRVEIVGSVSVGDLVYSPLTPADETAILNWWYQNQRTRLLIDKDAQGRPFENFVVEEVRAEADLESLGGNHESDQTHDLSSLAGRLSRTNFHWIPPSDPPPLEDIFPVDSDVHALFEFDGNVEDESGNDRDATLIGGEFVATTLGQGLFVSADGWVDWSPFADLLVHPYTIEVVLTPSNTTNAPIQETFEWQKIFGFDDSDDDGWYYRAGGIQAWPNETIGEGLLLPDELHYLAFVSTAPDQIDVYFQGAFVDSTDASFTAPPGLALFFRDDTNTRDGSFPENLDAVVEALRTSGVARTASEIVAVQEAIQSKLSASPSSGR